MFSKICSILNAPKPVSKSFKRKIWLYNQGDFDEYRRLLSLTDWESIFSTDDIDKISLRILRNVFQSAGLFRRLALLWILFFFLMSFLISFVNHAGSCFLIVTSLFGIVASAGYGSPSIRSSTLPLSGHWFLECP
jgi:cellulose synthase/poly-beta-1,6-N-acetylglucosamine synthase-like glycosyltransferase